MLKHYYNNLGVRRKLYVMLILALVLALTVTTALFSFYDITSHKRQLVSRMEATATLVANRSSAAVVFIDVKRAEQNLESLNFSTELDYVCLYNDKIDQIVADKRFIDSNHECDPFVDVGKTVVTGEMVRVHRDILYEGGQKAGVLVLYGNFSDAKTRLIRIITSILISSLAGLILAQLLTLKLQRGITLPVLGLHQMATRIRQSGDYSLRANKSSNDEIGDLVDEFNAMLAQLQQDQELLEELAYYDALTNLPNRRMFKEKLARAFVHSHGHGSKVGLIFIDLDNFKWVNDQKGHDVGDLLLQTIATKLNEAVEDNGLCCRLGGDEFTIIVDQYNKEVDIEWLAQQVVDGLKGTIKLGDFDYKASASLGVAQGTSKTDNINTLMKKADIAVYDAKHAGKDNYKMYVEKE